MRLMFGALCLISFTGAAVGESSTPPGQSSIRDQVQVSSFQANRRDDNYGIASFVISNTTDRALSSIELNCWIDDERERATKVMVWPTPRSIAAHEQQKFSNVNIGLIGPKSRTQCEVTAAETEAPR